ncbi:MAG: MarR family winged helix-turn-helix transcriptional regulator [Sphingomicrobium sp.]
MTAYLTDALSAAVGSERSPIIIAGSSPAALDRAARTISAAGFRIADQVILEAAPYRIERQVAASAVWLELDGGEGQSLDRLLEQVDRDVANGRYPAVVAAPVSMVDSLAARLGGGDVELVIDGDDADRAAALAVAMAQAGLPARLSDVASERSAARLRQLSDEVSRIASTLARLSAGPVAATPAAQAPAASAAIPEVSADTIRAVIRARRLRSRFFSEELFADPAWDMLLDLLQAEISQLRVPVSSLCIAAAVPATTALRWLKTMTRQGMFVRRADPHDGRRVFVELAPEASDALRRYFADIGRVAAI